MSTSFVSLRGRGFWAPDGLLEVWLWYLADALESLDDGEVAPPGYVENLRDQATSGYHGFISVRLDELSEAQRARVATAARRCVSRVQGDPSLLHKKTLNTLGLGGEGCHFGRDLPVARLEAIGRVFVGLLDGTCGWDVRDDASCDWLSYGD